MTKKLISKVRCDGIIFTFISEDGDIYPIKLRKTIYISVDKGIVESWNDVLGEIIDEDIRKTRNFILGTQN